MSNRPKHTFTINDAERVEFEVGNLATFGLASVYKRLLSAAESAVTRDGMGDDLDDFHASVARRMLEGEWEETTFPCDYLCTRDILMTVPKEAWDKIDAYAKSLASDE